MLVAQLSFLTSATLNQRATLMDDQSPPLPLPLILAGRFFCALLFYRLLTIQFRFRL